MIWALIAFSLLIILYYVLCLVYRLGYRNGCVMVINAWRQSVKELEDGD